MEKILRTPEEIRRKIEGWLIRHEGKGEDEFDGREPFTLYSKVGSETLPLLERVLDLHGTELPALVLFVGDDGYIVNTTERFIRIVGDTVESLPYSDFLRHAGYASILAKDGSTAMVKSIKSQGGLQEFGIRTKSGKVLYWTIPTGEPGFAFWNITNKCEVIGRRFLIGPGSKQ